MVCAATLALGEVAGAQTISTFAGGGTLYGDGGPATAARLVFPWGLAIDAEGNVYVGDDADSVVRRIDRATGTITTIAGNGTPLLCQRNYGGPGVFGSFDGAACGDGGPATSASLVAPVDLAVDQAGNVYIVDPHNWVVRKVDVATGIITTVAGGGPFGVDLDPLFEGDGGPATDAVLQFPFGVAVDAADNLYIADSGNARVRKVTAATGIIDTIAGNGTFGSTGDGGPALQAGFTSVDRVALDALGNIYVVDSLIVRKIDAVSGIITTVAGGGSSTGESGLAVEADLGWASVIAPDAAGNLYIAGWDRFRVWMVDPSGAIRVLAGTGNAGFSGDGGPAITAQFNLLYGIDVARNGDVYISDSLNQRVRQVTMAAGPDTTPPVISGVPADIVAEAATSGGVIVDYTPPTALDDWDGAVAVTCAPPPDTLFPIGTTTITCVATDAAGNSRSASFSVSVQDTQPPTFGVLTDITSEATSTAGAVVSYPLPMAADAVDPAPTVSCAPAPGSVFPLGATTVLCTATDASGNTNSGSFTVTVMSPDVIIDETTPQSLLDGLTNVPGCVAMVGTSRATLIMPNLESVGNCVIVTENPALSEVDLTVEETIGGDVTVTENTGAESIDLTVGAIIGGDVTVSENTAATSVNISVLGGIDGSLGVTGNSGASSVSVETPRVDGSVTILDNGRTIPDGSSNTILLPEIGSVGGDLTISRNRLATPIGTPDISSVGGDLTISDNSVTVLDGSSHTIVFGEIDSVGGDAAIVGNSVAMPDGSSNTIFLVEIGSVGGDFTVSGNRSSAEPSSLDVSGTIVEGDESISTRGTTSVSGLTGGGSTSVTLVNGSATMNALLPESTFASNVPFTVESLGNTGSLTGPIVDGSSNTVIVTELAAYHFTFAIATLNQDATLTFDINVPSLDADSRSALLAGVASDSATLGVQGDAPGSVAQVFDVCAAGQAPTAGGCVQVVRLDASGGVIPDGDPTLPATVRFMGVTGHFSTFAVVLVSPIPDTVPPVISGVPAPIVAEATSPAGAVVAYAAPTALDDRDGAVAVDCAPASGGTFPLGTTTVTCEASDASGNRSSSSFTVTVQDTTPPALTCPASQTLSATSTSGAVVSYPPATVSDAVDAAPVVSYSLASGTLFPIGITTVTATATDVSGNGSSCTFTATVKRRSSIGTLFVTDRDGNNEIYVMDADGGGQTNLTNHPGQDFDPAWSRDGSRIAFSSFRDGNREIYVMNADGSEQTNLSRHAAFDGQPAWSPDGTKVAFISNRDGNTDVYVMNADGSDPANLTNMFLGGSSSPAWSPDGGRIAYVGSCAGAGGICVMNADGTGQTLVSNDGLEPAWSPDGSKIAFTAFRVGAGADIYVMAADGSDQRRLTSNSAFSIEDREPSWSLDGSQIVFLSNRTAPEPAGPPFSSSNFEIYVMHADGSNPKNLSNNPADEFSPEPYKAPRLGSGKILFLTDRDGNNEIYVMDADGGGQTNLTNHPGQDFEPAWSPDGSRIAFSSFRDGNREVYVMNADGSDQTNLSSHAAFDGQPAWSPDGTKVAFISNRDGNTDVHVMNADGSDPANLTNMFVGGSASPAWSPGGGRIAYVGSCAGAGGICVMNADGTGQTLVSNDGLEPAWSPDGSKIAFTAFRVGAGADVYVMAADGSDQRQLTTNSAFSIVDREPSWSLDGSQIVFLSNRTAPEPMGPPFLSSNFEIYVMFADGSNPRNLSNNAAGDFSPDCGLSRSLLAADRTPPTIGLPADVTAEATSAAGAAVSYPATATDAVDPSPRVSCVPASDGTFPLGVTTVRCTAIDASGNISTASFTITVQDTTPPLLTCPADITVLATLASGANVAYSGVTAIDTVSPVQRLTLSPPPGALFPIGTTMVAATATDAAGNVSSCSFTVTVLDVPPTARDDNYTTGEDTARTVAAPGVLQNDSRLEGRVLTAILVSGPANGSLTHESGGSFTYTPIPDFNGTDSFSYKANDGSLDSAPATVTIAVFPVNDAPIPSPDMKSTVENTPLTFPASDLTANDSPGSAESGQTLAVTRVFDATSGTVVLNADNTITFTPAPDYTGTASFFYEVWDNGTTGANPNPRVATSTVTVTVTDAELCDGVDDDLDGLVDEGFADTDGDGIADCVDPDDDDDGIPDAIDLNNVTGKGESLVFSSDFNDGVTSGTLADRGGWEVTVRDLEPQGVQVRLAGAGAKARIVACDLSGPEQVSLDAVGETANITCGTKGSVTVTATASPNTIQLRKAPTGPGTRVILTRGQTATMGSPVTADPANTEPILVEFVDAEDIAHAFFQLDPGESVDVSLADPKEGIYNVTVLSGTITLNLSGQSIPLNEGQSQDIAPFNTPPTAHAGADQTVEATSASGAAVTLDGSGSSDGDGDALSFTWTGPFGTASGASPIVTFPLGTNTAMLTVSDGKATVSDTVVVTVQDTTPPAIACPAPVTAAATSPAGAVVDYPPATASDAVDAAPVVTYSQASGTLFPVGTTTVTVTATDAAGNSSTCSFTVTVTPVAPPGAALSLTNIDSPDPVTLGSPLTYTVTIANGGPSMATDVWLFDTVWGYVRFVSATASQGRCVGVGGLVACDLGTLADGATATVTVVVIPKARGNVTSTAYVWSPVMDPDPADNQASTTTRVR